MSENDYLRPIDIRHKRRPITFHLEANDGLKAEKVRRELTENLKTALKKSAKAALEHIHKELLPYERCEDAIKEMQFEGKFIFKGNLKGHGKSHFRQQRTFEGVGIEWRRKDEAGDGNGAEGDRRNTKTLL